MATGCALQVAESLFPHPIPGIRLGLANIMTLTGLNLFGYAAGFQIALLRPLVSSLMLGSFLTPGFLMSFSGSVLSFFVMALAFRLNYHLKLFSGIGISILGAVSHNLVQLTAAYLLFVRHPGIYNFIPILLLSGLITGCFTGYCVNYLVSRKITIEYPSDDFHKSFGTETEGKLSRTITAKVIICILLMLLTFVLPGILGLLYITPIVFIQGIFFKLSFKRFFMQFRFLWIIILSSLLMHLFLTPGESVILFTVLKVSRQGLHNAGEVTLRIILIVYLSSILIQKTPWIALIGRFIKEKHPLKNFMLIIPFSITLYPAIWENIRNIKPKTLKNLLDNLL